MSVFIFFILNNLLHTRNAKSGVPGAENASTKIHIFFNPPNFFILNNFLFTPRDPPSHRALPSIPYSDTTPT